MSDPIFSQEKLRKTIQDLPPEQGGVGVVLQNGEVGVTGAVKTDVGKPGGWTLAATGQWIKSEGYRAAAWLGWTGKT